jgi:hypothetical protein
MSRVHAICGGKIEVMEIIDRLQVWVRCKGCGEEEIINVNEK